MFKESVTTLQALLLCVITFGFGSMIGNKKAETVASVMIIIFTVLLMSIS